MRRPFFIFFILVNILSILHTTTFLNAQTKPSLSPLYVLNKKRCIKFSVEIAKTSQEIEKGLMFRKSMNLNQGMLFIFPNVQQAGMWMKNTFIPLDMLFVDKDGIIQKIQHQATPFSQKIIRTTMPVQFVIEINGGIAKQLDINVGDQVFHSLINSVSPLCQEALRPSKIIKILNTDNEKNTSSIAP